MPGIRSPMFAQRLLALAIAVGLGLCAFTHAEDRPQVGELAKAVQPFVDSNALAGAVMLVADREGVRAVETVGWADISAQAPMQADTVGWIASQTKSITATAVMMLVDEGKLSLDDPIEKYLPEFKGQWIVAEQDDEHMLLRRPAHPITLRNVLNHTSGLRFRSAVEHPTLDGLSLETAVRCYALPPLQFEPDTQYLYSNEGINTAARVLEVVSGQTFEAFLQERLLDPLGMTDTTFWPSEEQLKRLAKSYRPNADNTGLEATQIVYLRYPLNDRTRYAMPAGGLFSTAGDVAKFCRMLLCEGELDGHRYLSAEAVREMTTRQTPASVEADYGLGFMTGEEFGHGGAHATHMSIAPRQGLVTVWMVQHVGFPKNGNDAQGVFRRRAAELYGKPQP